MMAKIDFQEILQNSQELRTDDEHMSSRIFFDLDIDGKKFSDLYVDVKQTIGFDFETSSLEVGPPQGYDGPFSHSHFREEVETYYRESFGTAGRAFSVDENSQYIYMENNKVILEKHVEFEVHPEIDPACW